MRVLVLHSRYRSGDASGENTAVDDEIKLLTNGGHEVEAWQPIPEEGSWQTSMRLGQSAVWSRRSSAHVRNLVVRHRPHVAHVHNLFPMLSPAVLRELADLNVPIVATLHNYRLMCLPATFLRDGVVCEDCLGRTPWRGVRHKCFRDSTIGSAVLATSLAFHRAVRSFERIGLFIAVSSFVREKHVEAGVPRRRIVIKPNFAWPATRRKSPGKYFLYLGRLSPEKGIAGLVNTWDPAWGELVVAGDGPDARVLRGSASVTVGGALPRKHALNLLGAARAVLVPSASYEAGSRAVVEAYAAGVPVIANRIGGLAEVVDHGKTGVLVDAADDRGWADSVKRLLNDSESERLGNGAWRAWHARYAPPAAFASLEKVYARAASATSANGFDSRRTSRSFLPARKDPGGVDRGNQSLTQEAVREDQLRETGKPR